MTPRKRKMESSLRVTASHGAGCLFRPSDRDALQEVETKHRTRQDRSEGAMSVRLEMFQQVACWVIGKAHTSQSYSLESHVGICNELLEFCLM